VPGGAALWRPSLEEHGHHIRASTAHKTVSSSVSKANAGSSLCLSLALTRCTWREVTVLSEEMDVTMCALRDRTVVES
jgi:hypothetical protein